MRELSGLLGMLRRSIRGAGWWRVAEFIGNEYKLRSDSSLQTERPNHLHKSMLLILILITVYFVLARQRDRAAALKTQVRQPGSDRPKSTLDTPTHFRPGIAAPAAQTRRNQPKPAWAISATLHLIAISKKGCRTVANLFNQKYAHRGITISKSYVSELRKKSKALLVQINRRIRKPARRKSANLEWAIDYTEFNVQGERITLIGIIDCGTRRVLDLSAADKSADTLEAILTRLFALHGKPRFIKTDNDGSFLSAQFKAFLVKNDIVHRKSAPHSPWQNGTIERFFRTFKEALVKIKIENRAQLAQAVDEFAFFYNHIRTHQSLDGITPMAAWRGASSNRKRRDLDWYSNWNGELCGWYDSAYRNGS
jgi:putative transposase